MHGVIFAGLGPPIGLAVVLAANALDGGDLFSGPLTGVIAGIAFMAVWAYAFGLIPALVAAMAVRQVQVRRVKPEWLWVTFAGIGIGLIFVLALGALFSVLLGSSRFSFLEIRKEAYFFYVLTCLIPTLICWRLSLWRDKSIKPNPLR